VVIEAILDVRNFSLHILAVLRITQYRVKTIYLI